MGGQSEHPEWVDLNSGLMVIEPNEILHSNLINNIKPTIDKRTAVGNNTGDQDVFQETFKDWKYHKELLLPEEYNVFFRMINVIREKKNLKKSDLNVIHFIGAEKPWSEGIFTVLNAKKIIKMILEGHIYQAEIYCKYLAYSK
ncbi:MAG: glycosyltransferase [Bacteroidales bacterium]|nr:glycosyltransferase [Bacteroidales bacterium]